MKRRQFLKSSMALGGALSIPASLFDEQQMLEFAKMNKERHLLLNLENESIKLKLFNDASAEIENKKNDVNWNMGPVAIQEFGPIEEGHVWLRQERSMCEQYPGRFIGEKIGDEIRFTLIGRQNRVMGTFTCAVKLENDWLIWKILKIDECIRSLVFPPPVYSDSLVLPKGIGQWIREPESRFIYPRYLQTFFTHLNMRWIGGLKADIDSGWIMIYDHGFEDAYAMVANRSASPAYAKTLGKWAHPFTLRYKFTSGGYVGIAKTYRTWAQEQGIYCSLKDKIADYPDLNNMLGGRSFWYNLASAALKQKTSEDFWLTEAQQHRRHIGEILIHDKFSDVLPRIEKFKKLGLKKGFFKIAGWINGGYDASHPDVWPPEPELGSIAELRKIMALEGSVFTGLHDNYQDIYEGLPSFPNGVNRLPDGSLQIGGVWGGGQSYILSAKYGLKYAQRNWEKIKTLNPKAMFIDTTTAMQLYQSFEKQNCQTKADDLKYKLGTLNFYKEQGVLLGSEEVADFGTPYVDWFETRHARIEGETIPLWPLVYHDAAFVGRYGHPSPDDEYPRWLEDMLWGYFLHFFIRSNWELDDYFKSTTHVDEWHQRIGTAEMISHRFVTDDFKVEETVFEPGVRIIVNFDSRNRTADDMVIPAQSYKIRES